MFISKIQLRNFKRFTNLTVNLSELTSLPKLVLLIGANGSGKSSVFDAFELLNPRGQTEFRPTPSYFIKKHGEEFIIQLDFIGGKGIDYFGYSGLRKRGDLNDSAFYGRSALRQVPFLRYNQRTDLLTILNGDLDRPASYAGRDYRLYSDIEMVARRLLEAYQNNPDKIVAEVRADFIRPLNEAITHIFGENSSTALQLNSLIPSAGGEGAEVRFKKGESDYHYNLLSTGEKEVFNILLDLFVRTQGYSDTVYFIDELDVHLNTSLQKALLKEVVENWIPPDCQLWIASHSLGFIEYANECNDAVIIDFDNLDFDTTQELFPAPKSSIETFSIAVPKDSNALKIIFDNSRIIFVENEDKQYYGQLKLKDHLFFSAQNRDAVFYRVEAGDFEGIIDHDYLLDDECEMLKTVFPKLKILNFYSIENYLYHPQNLDEYYHSQGKEFDLIKYQQDIVDEKNKVKDRLIARLSETRKGYPFFKKQKPNLLDSKTFNSSERLDQLTDKLGSNEFEVFYPVFPMKDYGTQIPLRHNINPEKLAQTKWFKNQIQKVLND